MQTCRDVAEFLYSGEFWYGDPLREVDGLTEKQLLWAPAPKALCALWHVGHIAHRERTHIGGFLQGLQGELVPQRYCAFGPDWWPADTLRDMVGPVGDVLAWVREVRDDSRRYIESLDPPDLGDAPATADAGLTVGHWLFITTAHTALHIGRIQLLRALIEGEHERAC
jgi:hypothetical protein